MNNPLSTKRRGMYSEHRVIAELIRLGFDVYTSCVDEIGIDCVIRINNGKKKYYDIQIKKCEDNINIPVASTMVEYLKSEPDNYILLILITYKNKPDNNIIYLMASQITEFKPYAKQIDFIIPAEKRDEFIKTQSLEKLKDILQPKEKI